MKLSPNPGDKLHKIVSDYGLQLLFIANGKYNHSTSDIVLLLYFFKKKKKD